MLEFLVVFYEYYWTCRLSHLLANVTISLVFSSLLFLNSDLKGFDVIADKLNGNIVGVLGVLVGFSISMFTLLNTASSPNIDKIKKIETGFTLYKKPVYLFQLLIVSMIYLIIFESFLLIGNLLMPFFFSLTNINGKAIFCLNIFFLIHVILTNVSTVVNFYFIITENEKDKSL